jgi:hypothetical protein
MITPLVTFFIAEESGGDKVQHLKVLRILRVAKVIRILRLVKIIKTYTVLQSQ